MHMPGHTDPTTREGSDADQLLDQLLAHHRTQLTDTVTHALDTDTGSTALGPLRRELFQGLTPVTLAAPVGCTANASTPDSAVLLPAARLQEVLTRLRDIRLMVERTCASADLPTDIHIRAQNAVTTLQRIHTGLQARNLSHNRVCELFRELREQTVHIGTSMLARRTQTPPHIAEEWLRGTASLQGIERTALRLFRNTDDSVPTQS
ncbi:hypothetical protein ABZ307_44295 [Streptomyces griseorubiginosus]|uniref:hypothetical protein n=1 Tax=Streptomyces griseorubiginosus TaxID=67304 RepID=UPI0033B48EFD